MSTPSSSSSSGKVCSRCGEDCSNKQRVKDAQGRYICADCVAKARQAKPASAPRPTGPVPPPIPKAAASEDQSVLNTLINESVEMHKHGCPNCHAPMKPTQMLCIKCGFNKERGKQMQTVVKKALQEKGIDDGALKRRRKRWFINNAGPGVALLVALIAVAVLGTTYFMALNGAEEMKLVFLVTHGVFGFITFIFVMITAFMDSVSTGFTMLFCWIGSAVIGTLRLGILGFGSLFLLCYVLYWVFVESESPLIQGMVCVYILSTIAAIAMVFQMANGG